MERKEFFDLIEQKGFKIVDKISIYGDKYFETDFKHDGWMNVYSIKHKLIFQPTFGIKFSIDKLIVGGFTGNQEIEERLFCGTIDTEEDFENVLKYIDFAEKE